MGTTLAVSRESEAGRVAGLTPELEGLRDELDRLDAELIRMLARRLDLGLRAARIKRAAGLPVLDAERESSVIGQARTWAREAGLSEDEVAEIFTKLISLSGRAQMKSG